MKFTKMHGLGNDYVCVSLFEESVADPAGLARVVSDRHRGIGSDGLILIGRSEVGHVRMEMYNADGSRAQMCGNGIRCVAKYAAEHGLAPGPELQIETDVGVLKAWCQVRDGLVQTVRVDMGCPELAALSLPSTLPVDRVVDYSIEVGGLDYRITCVSMGNPHVVVFLDDPGGVDLADLGPLFEHCPAFPERINAHFVRVDSSTHVTMRTWERGSGETLACGTGACAVCVAGALTHRTQREVTVTLPGGDLHVEWAADDHVYMTGPAVGAFTGEWP
ncbi:MAG: diaminopimelate epimerase [Phycisphaerales bacterium]|nr:MAG: diaminopimelate epimerase [Phycisphaerales bacterium]